ncbi:MAG: hypothetical protein RBR87_02700 [Bacteroidales bacterium]|jgi:predicted membrane protein|nr:hypothetical protein [Bacteroidales bacterium]
MRAFLLIITGFLLLSLASMPMGYYTFLRIIVFISAIVVVVPEYKHGLNFWVVSFGIVGILFNPILPVYLYDKNAWAFLDIAAAVLFFVKSFYLTK